MKSIDPMQPTPSNAPTKSPAIVADATQRVLCVDMDGTLVKSDTLVDSLCSLAHTSPLLLLRLPFWIFGGKAKLKQQVARQVTLDVAHLPYNTALLTYLREEAGAGRRIVLATGGDQHLAERVAQHLGVSEHLGMSQQGGIFQEVLASDGTTNLTGARKLQQLRERIGADGFDYIGNSRVDLPLLTQAGTAMTANPTLGLRWGLRGKKSPVRTFEDRQPLGASLLRALRPHQWAKNLLLLLPLLLAHQLHWHPLGLAALAFACFCLTASSTYIVNDLLDIEAYRKHPHKARRPFAAGDLSPFTGAAMAALLLSAAGVLAWQMLPRHFVVWLALYGFSTLAYSLYFKRKVLVDVILLSALYTLRILAGAAAIPVAVSPWLAGFAIFFFFSLAMVKRFSELENLRARGDVPANGRGYLVQDLEPLRSFGTASAYASIVIFALYINNPEVVHLYRDPHRLWLMTPVLIWWLSRVWLLASRGQMKEDPVVFALTDRSSLLAGVAILLVAVFAAL